MDWIYSQELRDIAVSVVTIVELERGVQRKERTDPAGARPLRLRLDEDVRPAAARRLLHVDERTAITAAALHTPDPLP